MGVSRCRGGVFVTEQRADNRQTQAVHNADRCKRMAQIMKANVTKPCRGSGTRPDSVNRTTRSADPISGNDT
jgi:hypothetical protein